MKPQELSKYMSEIGRRGAQARLRNTTPEQRKQSAIKASKAAARARKRKAAERKGGR